MAKIRPPIGLRIRQVVEKYCTRREISLYNQQPPHAFLFLHLAGNLSLCGSLFVWTLAAKTSLSVLGRRQ
ncbi:hypothetical protein X975_19422, partial [Stegodyphus mimosarum]